MWFLAVILVAVSIGERRAQLLEVSATAGYLALNTSTNCSAGL
jgi:hypothetical protein